MEIVRSYENDPNIEDLLAYNNIPHDASILNVYRDPRKTTTRYAETDDIGVLRHLNDYGWFVVEYKEIKPHSPSRQGFQKYLATFENTDFTEVMEKGKPRIIQRGSHDGSAPYILDAGFLVWACLNGVICGTKLFESFKIKHIGSIDLAVDRAITTYLTTLPKIFSNISDMTKRVLSPFEQQEFALYAIARRFEDKFSVHTEDVLRPRRSADDNPTLWSVYNRVQENLIKPYDGFKIENANGVRQKVRAISNIDASVKLNKELWDIAETYIQ